MKNCLDKCLSRKKKSLSRMDKLPDDIIEEIYDNIIYDYINEYVRKINLELQEKYKDNRAWKIPELRFIIIDCKKIRKKLNITVERRFFSKITIYDKLEKELLNKYLLPISIDYEFLSKGYMQEKAYNKIHSINKLLKELHDKFNIYLSGDNVRRLNDRIRTNGFGPIIINDYWKDGRRVDDRFMSDRRKTIKGNVRERWLPLVSYDKSNSRENIKTRKTTSRSLMTRPWRSPRQGARAWWRHGTPKKRTSKSSKRTRKTKSI
tara:strand:- start:1850 stop:2638 length:789 start_codon:yes stop_codon:yes gene_type:complete